MTATFGALGHAAEQRAAAIAIAARVASEHPTEMDDVMPRLAGRQLAQDPAVAADVRELLDVLGLLPDDQTTGDPNV